MLAHPRLHTSCSWLSTVRKPRTRLFSANAQPARPDCEPSTPDLGWNDISWNNPQIRSPRIHALAEAGVKLINHHTFKWCSPSRSSFMTGRYPYHLGQQTTINMNPATTLPCGIHPSYDFIPKLLRSQGGYATVRSLCAFIMEEMRPRTPYAEQPVGRVAAAHADFACRTSAQHALGKWHVSMGHSVHVLHDHLVLGSSRGCRSSCCFSLSLRCFRLTAFL